MSDALTDIARDESRGRSYTGFLNNLLEYLKSPSEELYGAVEELAKRTDRIPGGYFGGSTSLSSGLKEFIDQLREGSREAWARFLFGLDPVYEKQLYSEFKSVSPFAEDALLRVDYGMGFVNFGLEDLERMIHNKIKERNWVTHDCDKYLIIIKREGLEERFSEADVMWVRCGIGGVNEPRKREG
jgi:hypothetical protein